MSHMPLWRGAVGAGDAGPVQHEGHAALVQRDVHQHLVERPVEEGRVDRDHRVQAAGGQARRGDRGVLLGDADVVDPVGEGARRTCQADRAGHRRGDGDDVLAARLPSSSISSAKTEVQSAPEAAIGSAGVEVDRADCRGSRSVSSCVGGRRSRGPCSVTAVHDDRAAEAAWRARAPDSSASMSWPSIGPTYLQAQVLEHALRRDEVLQALLGAVQAPRTAGGRRAVRSRSSLVRVEDPLVAVGGAQRRAGGRRGRRWSGA